MRNSDLPVPPGANAEEEERVQQYEAPDSQGRIASLEHQLPLHPYRANPPAHAQGFMGGAAHMAPQRGEPAPPPSMHYPSLEIAQGGGHPAFRGAPSGHRNLYPVPGVPSAEPESWRYGQQQPPPQNPQMYMPPARAMPPDDGRGYMLPGHGMDIGMTYGPQGQMAGVPRQGISPAQMALYHPGWMGQRPVPMQAVHHPPNPLKPPHMRYALGYPPGSVGGMSGPGLSHLEPPYMQAPRTGSISQRAPPGPGLRKSCDGCVTAKRRCDGQTPCGRCVSRNTTCHYRLKKKCGPKGIDKKRRASTGSAAEREEASDAPGEVNSDSRVASDASHRNARVRSYSEEEEEAPIAKKPKAIQEEEEEGGGEEGEREREGEGEKERGRGEGDGGGEEKNFSKGAALIMQAAEAGIVFIE
ncbi:unnamed protein product [Chrysoparadoxa australica]